MVKSSNLFLAVFAALISLCPKASALFVQSSSTALSFNNIAREIVIPQPPIEKKTSQCQSNQSSATDSRVDYATIADKLLPNVEPDKIYVSFCDQPAQNVSAKVGQIFFVVLPEDENTSWRLKSELIETVSSAHSCNKRTLELRVLALGEDNIFIDNVVNPTGKVQQSRILRLRVKK